MTNWFDKLFNRSKDSGPNDSAPDTSSKNKSGGKDEHAGTSKGSAEPKDSGACDHSTISLREGSPDFELFIATLELESGGDLAHGARHLDKLLSFDPGNSEWLALLERYMDAVPDIESLIPRGDELYYTTEALRAYLWLKKGRLTEAIDLFASVSRAKPDSKYLEAWVLPWLEAPGIVEQLPSECAHILFLVVLTHFPEAKFAPVRQLKYVERWANLIERYLEARPDARAPHMQLATAGLFRKAGQYDKAIAIAQRDFENQPNWSNATALGLALRYKGSPDEAEKYFEKALVLDPADNSARLEAADTFFEVGNWQRALNWYEGALKKDSDQQWAKPSAIYCRWMITNQQGLIDEVVRLANNGNHRAYALAMQAFNSGLPAPPDATANILRQLREKILSGSKLGTKVGLTLSSLEAPSNFLAFRMEMEALGSAETVLSATCQEIPNPDPRNCIREVAYPLWNYQDTDASPALPKPPSDVLDAVAKLAKTKYDRQENFAAASHVASQLGPKRMPELLAVMVHPPAVPESWTALSWLPRVQLTVALIVAQLDEGWEGSARKEGLLSILYGPQDWTTNAAIRAMTIIGKRDEVLAYKVDEAFRVLKNYRPASGYCCWEYTLYTSWLELPHLFENERKELQAVVDKLESED